MQRKEFIKTCAVVCVGGVAFSAFLQSCASANYFALNSLEKNLVTIKKTEFIFIQKEKTVHRKFVLLKTAKYDYPICIYKLSEENYSALLMQCTHQSCELRTAGNNLVCPCHGSEFNNKGVVQTAPAEENLKTFKVTSDNENIYVQI